MNTKFKLIKSATIGFLKNKYLFECQPQKRTIITRGIFRDQNAVWMNKENMKYIDIPRHYFYISTNNCRIHTVNMGIAGEQEYNGYLQYRITGFQFNNYCVNVNCGGAPYNNMHFKEKDFPKLLSMFWQSRFNHFNTGLTNIETLVVWREASEKK